MSDNLFFLNITSTFEKIFMFKNFIVPIIFTFSEMNKYLKKLFEKKFCTRH